MTERSMDLTAFDFKADGPAAMHHPKGRGWTIWHSIAAWAGFWFAIGVYLWVAL